jgi:hypothetical protein
LPHGQLQVQEWHSLHDEHDEIGDQETACGHPELRARPAPLMALLGHSPPLCNHPSIILPF